MDRSVHQAVTYAAALPFSENYNILSVSQATYVAIAATVVATVASVALRQAWRSVVGPLWLLTHLVLSLLSFVLVSVFVFYRLFCPQKYIDHVPGYLIVLVGRPTSADNLRWDVSFVAWITVTAMMLVMHASVLRYFMGQGVNHFCWHLLRDRAPGWE